MQGQPRQGGEDQADEAEQAIRIARDLLDRLAGAREHFDQAGIAFLGGWHDNLRARNSIKQGAAFDAEAVDRGRLGKVEQQARACSVDATDRTHIDACAGCQRAFQRLVHRVSP